MTGRSAAREALTHHRSLPRAVSRSGAASRKATPPRTPS